VARRSRNDRSLAVGLTVFFVGALGGASLGAILKPELGDVTASYVAGIVILGTIVAMSYIWRMPKGIWHMPKEPQAERIQNEQQQEEEQREETRRREERRREVLYQKESALEYMCSMDGREFERFLANYFRTQGYGVTETPVSADQGADLLLYKDERRIAVQAKQWEGSVGNKAVHEAHVGRTFYHTYEAWVITTSSGFTKAAVDAARNLGVRLIGGEELASWISTTSRRGSQTGR
jgi:restriction endonuclease Mrr